MKTMAGLLLPLILLGGCASHANPFAMTVLSAHYDLPLTLGRYGRKTEAKRLNTEVANVAPGNRIISDSPPLCTQGSDFHFDMQKASCQDAAPTRL